jgi:carbonic anhydrase
VVRGAIGGAGQVLWMCGYDVSMKHLVRGVHRFRREVIANKDFFEKLSEGQSPAALFVTCSDSRINPHLLTQAQPGDIFVLRNAGNIVPPYGGSSHGGESATIEYAVSALNVQDVIVCGHSGCGAMAALLKPELVSHLPAVRAWLDYAEVTRRVLRENYKDVVDDETLLNIAVQENVLAQLESLQTHPSVAARVARGDLKLHAWVYRLDTGGVFAFDSEQSQFMPLSESPMDAPAKRVLKGALRAFCRPRNVLNNRFTE